ncbi:MAG TPA: four helix bundle protein [Patescibacteria group bacterium]|nr:four helix bundle protein [bacterium]HRT11396.1 four helix bundle protein [Patescibacteria group bacterium]HRU89865.1 four helix bundle protein [Patescibacteria group bacterium]
MIDNLLVFQKTYDWLLWIKSATERFSRVHKYSLGQQLQIESINLLKKIIIANQQKNKFAAINECLTQKEIVKVLVRLSKDYSLFDNRQYEFAAQRLLEIDRMLLGWQRISN